MKTAFQTISKKKNKRGEKKKKKGQESKCRDILRMKNDGHNEASQNEKT